jgi:hypothetical protein
VTTYNDCLAGVCPCSGPVDPGPNHECPPDPRSDEEIEIATYKELNRPYELNEGTLIQWP